MGQFRDSESIAAKLPVGLLLGIIGSLLILSAFLGLKYYQSLVVAQYDNINLATDAIVLPSKPAGVTAGVSTTNPIPPPVSSSSSSSPSSATSPKKIVSNQTSSKTTVSTTPASSTPAQSSSSSNSTPPHPSSGNSSGNQSGNSNPSSGGSGGLVGGLVCGLIGVGC